jgi:hypothetical protein
VKFVKDTIIGVSSERGGKNDARRKALTISSKSFNPLN